MSLMQWKNLEISNAETNRDAFDDSYQLWKQLLMYRGNMLTWCLFLLFFIEISSASSSNDCINNELGSIRQEIRHLRDENQNQTLEIASLKRKVESQDEMLRQKIIEELNNLSKAKEIDSSEKTLQQRSKRPVRLLPKGLLTGKKNGDDDDPAILRFYGPPTNCSDLSLLGYTLNGYYLVKSASETVNTLLETVYCAFEQPEESPRSSTGETRIGRLKFEPLGGISSNYNSIKRNVTHGISSTRMAHLINSLGKCIAIDHDSKDNGFYLIQWECFPKGLGMLWSWNEVSLGSGDKHLCNGHEKCATLRGQDLASPDIFQWNHLDAEGQRYEFLDSLASPGFYLIQNNNGKCISVPENTDRNGARIHATNCNASEPGQNWKWSYMY